MKIKRDIYVIHKDDAAITLMKPFSEEYKNNLFEIREDAYGNFSIYLIYLTELKLKYNINEEELSEIFETFKL